MMHNELNFRKEIEKADEQLQKGKKFFTNILSPLVGLSHNWSHRGLICLPNIQSRDDLRTHSFSEREIKVATSHYCGEISS